ncbi:MAG TPA: hypothetical protein PKM58_10370 [Pyrinomonadaceae bacterium]|nr:hypothetical protein [Pyrinomonadaceae bacterium]HNU07359.1 hypothetical protein [Pyrinomonadaceae bacterium]
MRCRKILTSILILGFLTGSAPIAFAETFDKVELIVLENGKQAEKSATIGFDGSAVRIRTKRDSDAKTFGYSDIRSIEYSYSKAPRWKTGLGLGAASIIFPPLLLIAIPIGFTKHRRHWLMIRTEKDFAMLKLSKKNRKLIIATLETRTGIRAEGAGENK